MAQLRGLPRNTAAQARVSRNLAHLSTRVVKGGLNVGTHATIIRLKHKRCLGPTICILRHLSFKEIYNVQCTCTLCMYCSTTSAYRCQQTFRENAYAETQCIYTYMYMPLHIIYMYMYVHEHLCIYTYRLKGHDHNVSAYSRRSVNAWGVVNFSSTVCTYMYMYYPGQSTFPC